MFQFARLPLPALFYSGKSTRALPRVGFPIRTSRDQRLVSTSSGLIAAAHVLHRLLAPRHPPCALSLLIMKNTCVAAMEFSRCTRATCPQREHRLVDGLSKLNSARDRVEPRLQSGSGARSSRGRRIPGELGTRTVIVTSVPDRSQTPTAIDVPSSPPELVLRRSLERR